MVCRNELSEEPLVLSRQDLRNANIGVLVGTLIAVLGAVAFRNSSEATLQLVGLAAFVGGLVVYTILDEMTRRRERQSRQ
jgi:ABC-type cobalamin transport system permease subunit